MAKDDPSIDQSFESGGDKAKKELLKEHLSLIQRFVRGAAKRGHISPDDIDDVMQEVYLRVLRSVREGQNVMPTDVKLFVNREVRRKARQVSHEYVQPFDMVRKEHGYQLPDFSLGKSLHVEGVERSGLIRPTQRFTLPTYEVLTPEYLANEILPFVQALFDFQRIANTIAGRKKPRPALKEIVQRSPVSVTAEGLGDAFNSLKEDIIPWRKEFAKRIAELKTKEAETGIKKKEAEVMKVRAASAKSRAEARKIEAEAEKLRAEARAQMIQNEKLRFELESARLKLALELVGKMGPELSEQQKLLYALKLASSLETLTTVAFEGPQLGIGQVPVLEG